MYICLLNLKFNPKKEIQSQNNIIKSQKFYNHFNKTHIIRHGAKNKKFNNR